MIQAFVDRWMEHREVAAARLAEGHPNSYGELVELVVRTVGSGEYGEPDPKRIHTIDDGDYQGTLLFVIGAEGYQPSTYWSTAVSYGSCSGCDTLQAISGYSGEPPTPEQVEQYMTLCLHLVQGMRQIAGYDLD